MKPTLTLRKPRLAMIGLCFALLPLAGCEMIDEVLGTDTDKKEAAKAVEEGKAIGGACRHALKSIEDCFYENPKSDKVAIYDGWREMDNYMRENKIEGMPSKERPPKPEQPLGAGEETVKP